MKVNHAIKKLGTGASVEANQRALYPDLKQGVIWGVDEYGVDCLVSSSDGNSDAFIVKAVGWLLAKPDPANPHPAEFAW